MTVEQDINRKVYAIKELIDSGEILPNVKNGDGENSIVQKGSNAVAFGENSVALGTSSTNAKDRGITAESTDSEIVDEWENSDPESDKFALVKGEGALVEGNNNLALGKNSHAEGNGTIASNNSSHSEGTGSRALGKYSHAEGLETIAEGTGSHTEGKETHTSGDTSDYSHAEGEGTAVEVRTGHAEGYKSIAARDGYTENTLTPHAQGTGSSGWVNGISHAEGNATIAQGLGAHSEGEKTFANGRTAHAEGLETVASGPYSSHAEGEATIASGEDSHAEGWKSEASGQFAHAEGTDTNAIGISSHAEGYGSKTNDIGAHAEGIHGYTVRLKRTSSKTFTNQSSGVTVHVGDLDVESNGRVTEVSGTTVKFSKDIFSSGTKNRVLTFANPSDNETSGAFGKASHAEGKCTLANAEAAHAEGYFTKVDAATSGRTVTGAHAEGYETFAGEWASHSEGYNCQVNGSATENDLTPDTDEYAGQMAHAEGNSTVAAGNASHAEGVKTFTQNIGEHAEGTYNKSNSNTIHSVGIGTSDSDRKNAFEIMQNGDAYLIGVGGYDGTNPGDSTGTLQGLLNALIKELPADDYHSGVRTDDDSDLQKCLAVKIGNIIYPSCLTPQLLSYVSSTIAQQIGTSNFSIYKIWGTAEYWSDLSLESCDTIILLMKEDGLFLFRVEF